jgi:translation elongation factor P/translation initiation factor 5A
MPRATLMLAVATAALLGACQWSSSGMSKAEPEKAAAPAPRPAPQPATAARTYEATASVQAVDLVTRQVVLRGQDGNVFSVTAGPEVRNLPQVKVGDVVKVSYREALMAELRRPGDTRPTTPSATMAVARAPEGARPAIAAAEEIRTTVTIRQVDTARNTVAFTGQDGLVRVVDVREPQMRALLKTLKPGDQVDVTFTEAVAISVEPAGR